MADFELDCTFEHKTMCGYSRGPYSSIEWVLQRAGTSSGSKIKTDSAGKSTGIFTLQINQRFLNCVLKSYAWI